MAYAQYQVPRSLPRLGRPSMGGLGIAPPARSFRDGSLGIVPRARAFRDGSLGASAQAALLADPWASYKVGMTLAQQDQFMACLVNGKVAGSNHPAILACQAAALGIQAPAVQPAPPPPGLFASITPLEWGLAGAVVIAIGAIALTR